MFAVGAMRALVVMVVALPTGGAAAVPPAAALGSTLVAFAASSC